MRKSGEISLTQDDADVRVRNEQTAFIHHIGRSCFADVDARDDIPNEFEVDLRDGDAGAAAGTGNRQGEIGLRFFAEVDRAEVALLRSRFGELRFVAQIGAARDCVHCEARHLDLLTAIGIEIAHFCNGRSLAQQTQEVEAPLLQTTTRGQETGRPAHLAFDFLYELLDDGSRALRLLALHGNERLTAFAVGIVHLDCGIDDQRAADQGNQ